MCAEPAPVRSCRCSVFWFSRLRRKSVPCLCRF